MKQYIAWQGFKYKDDANDMIDKQFYLDNVVYGDSEQSTFGNILLDRQETYILFLKHFEPDTFLVKLQNMINNASNGGLSVALGNTVEVERQENGYLITMNFTIRSL